MIRYYYAAYSFFKLYLYKALRIRQMEVRESNLRIARSVECRTPWLLKIPPKRRSGPFVHVILVLQEKLLDCSPVLCYVGLAIQLGVCELARVIFVFVHFRFSSKLSWWCGLS